MPLTFTSLFCGAGGLDLGFEKAGFGHAFSTDISPWSVATMRHNRPSWDVAEADITQVTPRDIVSGDVLLAGFPCQGFSLGGNRKEGDSRNYLFREVVRLAESLKPRYVLIENVLNLRTMREPETGKPFVLLIAKYFEDLGYRVKHNVFRVSHFGVPQTRRRIVFVASRERFPRSFAWPCPGPETPASAYLSDVGSDSGIVLPNHDPQWGFKSKVHEATGDAFDVSEKPVPCRFSRTGSDGTPLRSLDKPFPAVDTATIWGWAQGNVRAERRPKDRVNGQYVRNPNIDLKLWRITASRLRAFTDREYARLQTFPDAWEFLGGNKRDIHQQIGNAVPVQFAFWLGRFVNDLYNAHTKRVPMDYQRGAGAQLELDI
jgi:DNA (cytosine-5)-methyltransferase 1